MDTNLIKALQSLLDKITTAAIASLLPLKGALETRYSEKEVCYYRRNKQEGTTFRIVPTGEVIIEHWTRGKHPAESRYESTNIRLKPGELAEMSDMVNDKVLKREAQRLLAPASPREFSDVLYSLTINLPDTYKVIALSSTLPGKISVIKAIRSVTYDLSQTYPNVKPLYLHDCKCIAENLPTVVANNLSFGEASLLANALEVENILCSIQLQDYHTYGIYVLSSLPPTR